MREIPQLHADGRVLTLLQASVAENVATVLHILQHGIDPDRVHAPAAAEQYARRLAQRGIPMTALLRAYRIGSTRFQHWCLQELARQTDDPAILSAAGLRIAETTAAYIDRVSEELVLAYEAEKEHWLRNLSAARAARVRTLLQGDQVDVDAAEAVLGYRLRQYHVGVVCWVGDAEADGHALLRLEQATMKLARQAACLGRPLFVPQDESCAWAWLPLGANGSFAVPTGRDAAGAELGIRFAFGAAGAGVRRQAVASGEQAGEAPYATGQLPVACSHAPGDRMPWSRMPMSATWVAPASSMSSHMTGPPEEQVLAALRALSTEIWPA